MVSGHPMESEGPEEASGIRKPGFPSPTSPREPQDGTPGWPGWPGGGRGRCGQAGRPAGGRRPAPARRARPDVQGHMLARGVMEHSCWGPGDRGRGRGPRWEPGREPGAVGEGAEHTESPGRYGPPPPPTLAPRPSPQQPSRDQQTARSGTAQSPTPGKSSSPLAWLQPGPTPRHGWGVGQGPGPPRPGHERSFGCWQTGVWGSPSPLQGTPISVH